MPSDRPILVTGAAGFIGFHTATALLDRGEQVIGIDNFARPYDPDLKRARLKELESKAGFIFRTIDLKETARVQAVFEEFRPEFVINLGAQAGVQHSKEDPHKYVYSNVVGFLNILECCRVHEVKHLVYASSSSVYGMGSDVQSTTDNVDHPQSVYAATKKADELLAHSYSHQYNLPTTGLRFFTVYGPWGRPDMSLFKFTKALFEGKTITLYNDGENKRDYTYVDDVVEGVLKVMKRIPTESNADPDAPAGTSKFYRIYNIGNHHPERILDVVALLEELTQRTAIKDLVPIEPWDVAATYAEVDDLMRDVGFAPDTPIKEGAKKFVEWYRDYFKV